MSFLLDKTCEPSPIPLSRIMSAIRDFLPAPRTIFNSDKLQSSGFPKPSPEQLIDLAIENHIARVAKSSLVKGDESFFIADLGKVTRQHQRWRQNLPDVRPYYGILLLSLLFLLSISLVTHKLVLGQKTHLYSGREKLTRH